MTLQQIMENHPRNQWMRLCANNDIDKWTVVDALKAPIYITLKFIGKIEAETRACLLCNKLFSVGVYKENFYIIPTCACGINNKSQLTAEKLKKFMSIERANQIIKEINDKKTRKFPSRKCYWLEKGYSEEEASIEIKKFQDQQRKLVPHIADPSLREYSPRLKEYWIKKGFTESEAIEKVKVIQTKNGLPWYQQKYGDILGKQLFEERINRWLHNYYTRIDIKDVNSKKSFTREQFIEKYGLENWIKRERKRIDRLLFTLVKNGFACSRELLTDREIYYSKIRYYTRKSMTYFYEKINPTNLSISYKSNHIDHIFSKHHGFMFNIPPEIIGSYINLRVLPSKDNLSKFIRSDISLKELKEKYENIDQNWHTIIGSSKI
jgi:hypothetical protein